MSVSRAQTTVFNLYYDITAEGTFALKNRIGDVAFGGGCIFYGGRIVRTSGNATLVITDANGYVILASGDVAATVNVPSVEVQKGMRAPFSVVVTSATVPIITVNFTVKK